MLERLKRDWKWFVVVASLISFVFGSLWGFVQFFQGLQLTNLPIDFLLYVAIGIIGIIGLFILRNLWKQRLPAGIKLAVSRDELPLIGTLLSHVSNEIIIFGMSLEFLAIQNRQDIRHTLERGVHMKFLLPNPNSKSLIQLEEVSSFPKLKDRVTTTLATLCKIKNELPDSEKNKCEIRIHEVLPIHSVIVSDPNTPNAIIMIEFYLYNTDAKSRPSIIVSKREQETLFNRYWDSLRFVLDKSVEYKMDNL